MNKNKIFLKQILLFVFIFFLNKNYGQTAKYLVVSKLTKVLNGVPNSSGFFDTTFGYQIGSNSNSPFSGPYVDGPSVIFRREHIINLSQFPLNFNLYGYGYSSCLPQNPDYTFTFPTQSYSNTCNVDSPKRVDVVSLYLEQPTNNTLGNCDILQIARPYVPINTGDSNIYASTYQVRKQGETTWIGLSNSNSNSVILSTNLGNNSSLINYEGALDLRFGVMVPNGFGGFDWYYSNIITYNILKCSPRLIGSPLITNNTCYQSNNGSVLFNFDRALDSGEYFNMTLYKIVNGSQVIYGSQQVTENQFTNQQFSWNSLEAGTYILRYQTYRNGGSEVSSVFSSNSFLITQPSKVTFVPIKTDIICKGDLTGQIAVTATGGTFSGMPPAIYEYSKDGGLTWQTSNIFSGLTARAYDILVKTSNNCIAPDGSQTVTITEPATRVTISNPVVVNPILNGENTGSIDVDVSDGALPYNSFLWVNQANQTIATTEDITSLIAGTYTLTVTDASGCMATANFTLVDPPVLVPLITVNQLISCNGANNGILSASATGGTPGVSPNPEYSYEWRRNTVFISSDQQISNLIPGVYELKVTDSRGGFQTTTYTLSQPTPIIVSNTITNVTCNGANNGSIITTVSGGTPFSAPAQGYSYAWRINGSPTIISTNPNLTAVGPATYSCEIRDANNCIYNLTNVTITENPSIVITLNNQVNLVDPAINNGSINHFVSGGTGTYTYLWNTGQTSLNRTNLAAGTYTFTVTDSNGCSQTATYTITSPPPFTINILENNSINCYGEATANLEVIASGGTIGTAPNQYTYSWSGANIPIFETTSLATLSNLPAGTYTVQVRDANNVLRTLSYTITQPAPLTATYTKTDITCSGLNNGTINITPSGGTPNYTFEWSNQLNQIIATTEDVSNLPAGNYFCTITDANGCTFSITNIEIRNPNTIVISETITPISATGMSNGSISVTVTGGSPINFPTYTYVWTNSLGTTIGTTSSITNLSAGNYNLVVTDANGCTNLRTFSVDVIQPLTATITENGIIYCNGSATGSLTVNPSGGLPSSTQPAYTTLWNNGATTPTISGLTAGIYFVTVTDFNTPQSTFTTSYTITEPTPLVVSNVTHTNMNCFGSNSGSIDITVSGGTAPYSYQWRNASNIVIATTEDIANLNVGSYSCIITDANGCTLSIPATTITTNPQLVATVIAQTNVQIYGQSTGAIDINVTGGFGNYSYAWSNGATTQDLSTIPAGTYSVIITDELGCTTTLNTIVITQPTQLVVTENIIAPISCFEGNNGSITASVSGGVTPYVFTWTLPNGTTTNQQILSNRAAGIYTLQVRDVNNATATITITLTQPDELAGTFTSIPVSCGGNLDGTITINPTGGSGVYTYLWNTGATTQTITNASVGNYVVQVTDSNGCEKLYTGGQVLAGGGITINETIQDVTCGTPNSGSISLVVFGGSNQFSILWDNPTLTGFSVSNLAGGSYTGTITDIVSNCVIPFSYTLSEPVNVSFDLPDAITLCNGQTTVIDPLVTNNNVTYNWTLNNGFTSNNATITVSQEGTYSLTVTASNGCSFTDSVLVTVLSEAIESEYLVASQTYKDEEIILINVSEQTNETYEWVFPSQAIVISQNSQTAIIKFTEVGVYEIGLKAVNNSGCILYDYNQLVVEENPGLPEDTTNTIVIKDFKVYPNPVNLSQLFNVEVELAQSLPISISIYEVALGSLVNVTNFPPSKNHFKEYNLSISSGIYYIILKTPGNVQTKKLIIN